MFYMSHGYSNDWKTNARIQGRDARRETHVQTSHGAHVVNDGKLAVLVLQRCHEHNARTLNANIRIRVCVQPCAL